MCDKNKDADKKTSHTIFLIIYYIGYTKIKDLKDVKRCKN